MRLMAVVPDRVERHSNRYRTSVPYSGSDSLDWQSPAVGRRIDRLGGCRVVVGCGARSEQLQTYGEVDDWLRAAIEDLIDFED